MVADIDTVLTDEIEISMRLLGVTKVEQVRAEMVAVPPMAIDASKL